MSKSQRDTWKQQILQDYPRLNEMPFVVDNLLDLWEKNPEIMKKAIKDEEKKARKHPKKEETKEEEYDPNKYIITCISKEAPEEYSNKNVEANESSADLLPPLIKQE